MGMSRTQPQEHEVLRRLARRFGMAPSGQIWTGDDAALLAPLHRPLVSTDLVVEGVHVDRRWCAFSDMGYKAVTVNVSDIAAMGGEPRALVLAVAGATAAQIEEIMQGAERACEHYGCSVVGGDLSDGATLVICGTAIGECSQEPVRRSGSLIGDLVYVTGALGGSAAGLRLLRSDPSETGPLAERHRRPRARTAEGSLLGSMRVHAMLDCSDGLAEAARLLAEASGVGVALTAVPRMDGASFDEALAGGEDYELLFTVGPDFDVLSPFGRAGLARPLLVGSIAQASHGVTLDDEPLRATGYEHHLGADDRR